MKEEFQDSPKHKNKHKFGATDYLAELTIVSSFFTIFLATGKQLNQADQAQQKNKGWDSLRLRHGDDDLQCQKLKYQREHIRRHHIPPVSMPSQQKHS